MRSLTDHLSNYATYHRDRRNIATHFVGVPMIVVGLLTGLSRPSFAVGPGSASAATLLYVAGILFYLSLDLRFGAAMAFIMGGALELGTALAGQTQGIWLGSAVGLFVVGWVIQFIGHIFEGKKPAFVDDLIGLLVGPLFVVAEAGFALGLRRSLLEAIEARVGPTRSGPAPQPALN